MFFNLTSFAVFFDICAVPVEFIYRYYLLCHNETLKLFTYTKLLFVAFCGGLLFGLTCWFGYYRLGYNDTSSADKELGWLLGDNSGRVGAVGAIVHASPQNYAALTVAMVLTIGAYCIVVYCNTKIFKFMKDYEFKFSKTVRKANRELNQMLTIQAVVPFVCHVLPITVLAIGLVFPNLPLTVPSIFSCTLFALMPVANASCALILIGSYRKSLLSLISSKPFHKESSQSPLIKHSIYPLAFQVRDM
uniref:Uncharacterized protein n=1 Tax=Panagrolaimus sp. JU765 TaxID=591449 RepID=A0AC34RT97_9BILA